MGIFLQKKQPVPRDDEVLITNAVLPLVGGGGQQEPQHDMPGTVSVRMDPLAATPVEGISVHFFETAGAVRVLVADPLPRQIGEVAAEQTGTVVTACRANGTGLRGVVLDVRPKDGFLQVRIRRDE